MAAVNGCHLPGRVPESRLRKIRVKTYVVTSGSLIETEIDGVFSTRDNAWAFIEATCDPDDCTIEEVELDPDIDLLKRGYVPYEVIMDPEFGECDIRKIYHFQWPLAYRQVV